MRSATGLGLPVQLETEFRPVVYPLGTKQANGPFHRGGNQLRRQNTLTAIDSPPPGLW